MSVGNWPSRALAVRRMKSIFSLSFLKAHEHSFWAFRLLTWFGCGLSPVAPGTVGSLGALPPAAGVMWLLGPDHGRWSLFALAVLFGVLGGLVSTQYILDTGRKDPPEIVVDEVVGLWLVLCITPFTVWGWTAAFVAFRIADILKPFPVSVVDRSVTGGLGIMGDDIVAAAYASVCVALIHQYTPYLG